MSGILSCHLILTAFSNSLNGNGEVSLHDVGIPTRSHMHTRGLAASQPCRLSAWSQARVYHLVVHANFLDKGYMKVCI